MFAKLRITATMTVITGLHIGAAGGFSAIGAIDGPVVRDPYTGFPMLPGSSLKGKMRTLLAKAALSMKGCSLPECKDDPENIRRVFGTPGGHNREDPHAARVQFSDSFLANPDELLRRGGMTEDKAENFINRASSIAAPRHIERVVRGAKFNILWYYTAEDAAQIREDLQTLAEGCKLLELDYLGGSGTRGYGRVAFDGFRFDAVNGDFPLNNEELADIFKDVSEYAAERI